MGSPVGRIVTYIPKKNKKSPSLRVRGDSPLYKGALAVAVGPSEIRGGQTVPLLHILYRRVVFYSYTRTESV